MLYPILVFRPVVCPHATKREKTLTGKTVSMFPNLPKDTIKYSTRDKKRYFRLLDITFLRLREDDGG